MQTIQEIYEETGNMLSHTINSFISQVSYPEKPVKPRTPMTGGSGDYAEYAKELAVCEEQMIHSRQERDEAQRILYGLEEELRLFLIELSGWQGHPKADKAWSYAWSKGSSSGYYEVYNILLDLHDYFA